MAEQKKKDRHRPGNYGIVRKNLPFFAYGLFKKDELAYNQIKKHKKKEPIEAKAKGILYDKDGCACMLEDPNGTVLGNLIYFKDDKYKIAYDTINKFEPEFYKWKEIDCGGIKAYSLVVNSSIKESAIKLESPNNQFSWDSRNDPMFKNAMEYLYKIHFKSTTAHSGIYDDIFQLQMQYSLLYSVLNRYSDFKYGISLDNKKGSIWPNCFKDLYNTKERLHYELKSNGMRVTPHDLKSSFNLLNNSYSYMQFFSKIRNNTVHRGKAIRNDLILLDSAFVDLFYLLYHQLKRDAKIRYTKIDSEEIERMYNGK